MRASRTISFLYFGTFTIVIWQFLHETVLAGPVIKRSIRMVREVYPEIETDKHEGNQAEVCIVGDVVYGAEEPVPSDQPCLRCKCQPPGVQCELIQCSQKQGCRAIHKTNQCCPEYQCECAHNGTVYGNGERLATLPGGECKVCYCRGGEVQCTNVSCYKRSDCEGHTVPGQCCPKYDHCPLKEPFIDRSVPQVVLATASAVTTIYDVQELIDNNITDIHPTNIQNPAITDILTSIDNIHFGSLDLEPDYVQTNLTIQEIIPEIKEIPITIPPKQKANVVTPKTHTNVEEVQNKTSGDLVDTDSESSEISEIYHRPPPVLKIGNHLLVFKKGELVSQKDVNTPVPVITIIGAEGLQRGTVEDSNEFHEIPSQLQGPQKDVDNFDDFFENETTSNQATLQKETHIISFVKQKKLAITTTEPITDLPPDLFEFEEVSPEKSDTNMTLVDLTRTKSSLSTEDSSIQSEVSNEELISESLQNTTVSEGFFKNLYTGESQTPNPTEGNLHSTQTIFASPSDSQNSQFVENPSLSLVDTNRATDFQTHILINKNATLPQILLKQVAVSDEEEYNSTQLEPHNKTQTVVESCLNDTCDSGESTTARNNQTSEMFPENASVETLQDSPELNTTDMVEILPGFQIPTETIQNDSREERIENEAELIDPKDISTTNATLANDSDDDIFTQLNKEFNVTLSSLNLTSLSDEEREAEAIFKELLEEVTSSTLPPQDSSFPQLHERESQLLQRVSETISKFQSKESKEGLGDKIVGILKDYFSKQHKSDESKAK